MSPDEIWQDKKVLVEATELNAYIMTNLSEY